MKIEIKKPETIKPETIKPETIKTGSILEIKKTHAILLSEGMEFVCVRLKEGMAVGQTIYYLEEDIYRSSRLNYKNLLVYAASLCFMFLLMYSATHEVRIGLQTPLSYGIVTMDINPSVEIHIDETGEVLRLIPLNKDASKILLKKYSGMVLEEVLDILTENARSAGFLLEDGAVMLTYTVVNQEVENRPEMSMDDEDVHEDDNYRRLETYMEKRRNHYKFLFAKGTEEGVKAAKSQGLSLGKYNLLNYVSEDISSEEIKEMSIKEIFDIIDDTKFEYNHKKNPIFNKRYDQSQGPPVHSNASDQGRLSAPMPQSPQEDKPQNPQSINNNRNKDKEEPTDNSNENSNNVKDTPRSSHADQEKTNNSNKEKENQPDTDTDTDADIDIEINIETEKNTPSNNNSNNNNNSTNNSNKEKTNNGVGNQDNKTLEEVKDTEPEKVKGKDTTKVNSGKSETKSNPGNSKK